MKGYESGQLVKFMWKISKEQKGRIVKQTKNGLFIVRCLYSDDELRLPKRVLTSIEE